MQQQQPVQGVQQPIQGGQQPAVGLGQQLKEGMQQLGQVVQQYLPGQPSQHGGQQPTSDTQCVFDFTVLDCEHKPYPLSKHRGQCLLICNIATECSFAANSQAALETLFTRYKDKNFNILAFPSNDFMSESHRDDVAIRDFILQRWPNSGYPILGKICVNGNDAVPLWTWMKSQEMGAGTLINAIKGNYTSFLIDPSGRVVRRYAPGVDVEAVEKDLVPLLQQCGGNQNVLSQDRPRPGVNDNIPQTGVRSF